MKNLIKTLIVAATIFTSPFTVNAQKKVDQGTLVYSLDYKLTPEQKQKIPAGALPKEQTIQFNGPFSRIEMQQGPATITVISNHQAEAGLVLVDVPVAQMQVAAKLTKEDLEKQYKLAKPNGNLVETGETQTVASFKAKKFTFTDGEGKPQEIWVTTDVQTPELGTARMFPTLKGLPVKYQITQNGVTVVMTLKSLTAEKAGPFTLNVPEGYELKTMEELQQMGGGR